MRHNKWPRVRQHRDRGRQPVLEVPSMESTKTCDNCGAIFRRVKDRGSFEWERQRFCTSACYDEWRKRKAMRPCAVDGCDRPRSSRGWCHKHYYRWRSSGDPLRLRKAPNGSGHIDQYGYRIINIDGKFQREHRLVMERTLGRKLRRDEDVHHLDGDKLNNDPENLQVIAHDEHARMHNKLARGSGKKT